MAVIYRITNMANNHYYIGSAESFARREWNHKYDLKKGIHKNPRLQAAWNKYGSDMFVFEVIEEIPEGRNTFDVENTYLMKCVGQPDCYNINKDAFVPRLGQVLNEETKKAISNSRKGKHAGDQHYRYGTKLSEEVKAKISATQKGRPNKMKGQKMSEQGRANVIASIKRGKDSPSYGRRPTNAEDLQKKIFIQKPDGSIESYPSLTYVRDTFGVSLMTIIRACKSGRPIKLGSLAGYKMSYSPITTIDIPEEYKDVPRTRQAAKELGTKFYYTGVPCDRGHLNIRVTKGTCVACRKEDDKQTMLQKRILKSDVDTPSTT